MILLCMKCKQKGCCLTVLMENLYETYLERQKERIYKEDMFNIVYKEFVIFIFFFYREKDKINELEQYMYYSWIARKYLFLICKIKL